MVRVEDIGELVYGGAVLAAEEWDKRRITDLKITNKDVLRKAATYTYLVPGATATVMSAFGMMRRWSTLQEHLSHGFIYDFPRWLWNTVDALRTAGGGAGSRAIEEARRQAEAKNRAMAMLTRGKEAARSYQSEFESVSPHVF